MKGEFGGLGLEVRLENDVLKIVTPIDDTPAVKADLKPGDIILEIDGQSVHGWSLEQAVARMRGPVKTPVTLTIERTKLPEPIQVSLTRDTVKPIAVTGRLEGDVAYIKIWRFNQQTQPTLLSTVANLKKAAGGRLKGYVLDLRKNSGGLLDSAITIADDFLEAGTIFSTKGRAPGSTETKQATPGDIAEGKPIVIIANGATASGAEIVVAALQENRRAMVVGTRTFGNGTIQTVFPLGTRGAVRVTTRRFSTPNGRELETIGVAPDVVIEQSGSGAGRDVQLETALARLGTEEKR
jgi:carboxyl-terminal processing protease